jgi:hypothetical protein
VDGIQTLERGLRLLTIGQLAGGEYSFALFFAVPGSRTVLQVCLP